MEGKTIYYSGEPVKIDHTDDHCDKCNQKIGKKNLKKLPFLYMDKNDKLHKDMSQILLKEKRKEVFEQFGGDLLMTEMFMKRYHIEPGYRQYYCCKNCYESSVW